MLSAIIMFSKVLTFVRNSCIWKKWFLVSMLCLIEASLASTARARDASEEFVLVRGRNALIETLHMGPDQTEFWLRLRSLMDHPDLITDFQQIVSLFDLTVTDPVDSITLQTQGFASRRDAIDQHFFIITSLRYGITDDDLHNNERLISLYIEINNEQICITDQTIERIYGSDNLRVSSHWNVPPTLQTDPTGVRYSQGLGGEISRAPIVLTYVPSGCLKNITFQKFIKE
ncbi:hypothetical protein [Burkholderia sp. Ac-20365]|uniref:hypothetical protein n=1 Tax=Burkholderia sp. Ac-20365 TaxID=2703897 RepID=UPI00197B8F5E|nr:hypothetical protein [Burkholderia sp. Ac-20365]MBN3759530.1 hypothetical protein [Burkholderia sp. Ac-20365]